MDQDQDIPVELPIPRTGWYRWIPLTARSVRVTREVIEVPSAVGLVEEIPRRRLCLVELQPADEAARRGSYQVILDGAGRRLPLLTDAPLQPARAFAERLARTLSLRMQDFSGQELVVRRPEELDRPLVGGGPEPSEEDPTGHLERRTEGEETVVDWASPSLPVVAGAGVIGALAGMLGLFGVAAVMALLVIAGSLIREEVRVSPRGLRWRRGPLGLGRWSVMTREHLEQVAVDVHDSGRLFLISDHRVIPLRRSPEQIEWLRSVVLHGLGEAEAVAMDKGVNGDEAG